MTVPENKIQEAARKMIEYLIDGGKRKIATDTNYEIAKLNFGYKRLEKEIGKLMKL